MSLHAHVHSTVSAAAPAFLHDLRADLLLEGLAYLGTQPCSVILANTNVRNEIWSLPFYFSLAPSAPSPLLQDTTAVSREKKR